jgi:hypothetical protein
MDPVAPSHRKLGFQWDSSCRFCNDISTTHSEPRSNRNSMPPATPRVSAQWSFVVNNEFQHPDLPCFPFEIFTSMSNQLIFTRLLKSLHAAFPSAWSNTNNQDQIGIIYRCNFKSFGSMGLADRDGSYIHSRIQTIHRYNRIVVLPMSSSSCSLCAFFEHPKSTPRAYLCLPLCVYLRVRAKPVLEKRRTWALCGSHVSFVSLKRLTLTFVSVEHINNHQRCPFEIVAIDVFTRTRAPSKPHAYTAKAASSSFAPVFVIRPTSLIVIQIDAQALTGTL